MSVCEAKAGSNQHNNYFFERQLWWWHRHIRKLWPESLESQLFIVGSKANLNLNLQTRSSSFHLSFGSLGSSVSSIGSSLAGDQRDDLSAPGKWSSGCCCCRLSSHYLDVATKTTPTKLDLVVLVWVQSSSCLTSASAH